TQKFERHALGFMLGMNLLKKERYLVAVSGGLDSMALLHCLSQFKSFGYSLRLEVIHINHGTRVDQKQEADLVRTYSSHLGARCQTVTLSGLNVHKNFEFEARQKRYEAMRSRAQRGDCLVLGHHIDDSFEWSILQSLRSSNVESSLGIPVVNGIVARPFMCVTKAQIKKYVDAYDLPYLEDPTNEMTRYERNYIRSQISHGFASRYPKYLKHYVHRHNELARRLGKHIKLKEQSDFDIVFGKNQVEIISFEEGFNPSGLEFRILQAMNYLLPEGRGSLSEQMAKIIQAMKNHKSGPFTLAKGVRVYISANHLLICAPAYQSLDKELALSCSEESNRYRFKEFQFKEYLQLLKNAYKTKNIEGVWPLWVIVRQKRFNTESPAAHPLWPALFKRFEKNKKKGETIIPAVKLLKYWAKPQNRHKRLSLRLLLSL
ncbi:MAG: tRNA lysidine(34) synthetase TilS, partial [Bacteriovoracaceae bacterium]